MSSSSSSMFHRPGRIRRLLQDKVSYAENPVGRICIHHPQRWKVWRRGKRSRILFHYSQASAPKAWEIPFSHAYPFMMAARFGEEAAVQYANTFGQRCALIP